MSTRISSEYDYNSNFIILLLILIIQSLFYVRHTSYITDSIIFKSPLKLSEYIIPLCALLVIKNLILLLFLEWGCLKTEAYILPLILSRVFFSSLET